MKTVIIGGGKACREIIELASGSFLKELSLEIVCVMDPDADAPGMIYARSQSIETVYDVDPAIERPDIELILELTGLDEVLEYIHKKIAVGVKLIDHTVARIFWDLMNAETDKARRIDELAKLEEKLENESNFLQGLVDNIPDLIVVLDKSKQAIRVNKSFSKLMGLKPEEAIGKTCPELFAGSEFEQSCIQDSPMLDEVLQKADAFSSIWMIPPPHEAHWEVTRTPIMNNDSTIEGILAIWHRITEQVMLRREIETAEERFRSFIDSAHDWISMKDLDGKYIIVNPVTAEAFGLEPDDFIGKTAPEVLPDKLGNLIKKHDQEVIDSKKHRTYDEVVQIDGRDHHFQTVRFPFQDYHGNVQGVCTIMRDVTSIKNLQDQLVQSSKMVAIGQLAAGVAHEINNPLTGILAYAEDLEEELPDDNSYKDDVRVIIRETKRCRDIVRNLLDFARQEAPKLKETNPNKIIDQALELLKKLPQFRNIEIERKISINVPTLHCDQQQIQQVLLNLLLNASDAMKGKGRIRLNCEFDRRHDKCVISVKDNGPGIPENLIDKIFEPFFSTKGTNGLGLAVSWGIIERHHGTIEIDMVEDGGTIFNIILPAYHQK